MNINELTGGNVEYEAGDIVQLNIWTGEELQVVLLDSSCSPLQLSWHAIVTQSNKPGYPKGMQFTLPNLLLDSYGVKQ